MRAHPLVISSMLLATFALIGCERSPVDPETQSTVLYKPGGGGGGDGSGATAFDVVFSASSGWDLATDPYPIPGQAGVGNNSSQVETGGAGRDHNFRMSGSFLASIGDWELCFGQDGDGTAMDGFAGDIKPAKRGNGVTTTFYFNRVDRNGSAVGYDLVLSGSADGDFPPAVGNTVFVTFTAGEISTSGGGKGKKGPNPACVGDVTLSLDSGVSVEATG